MPSPPPDAPAGQGAARRLSGDVLACLGFFTRLPVPWLSRQDRAFGASLWAAPVAGLAVGAAGALAFGLADVAGLPPAASGLLALAATLLVTGCLHEDGLADVTDGFGGGRTRESKLEIMRDSRIGTYGAAMLFVSLGLRWSALATFASPFPALLALVAAHGASRAMLPAFLRAVPPAREDGLGAGVGLVPASSAWGAGLIGLAVLLPLGLGRAAVAVAILLLLFFMLRRLCLRQIGGQTGDVCGALQQGGEIAVLLVAAASFEHF